MYQTSHENSCLPWTGPSVWGSGNTFRAGRWENVVPHVNIPPSSYATDGKIFALESGRSKYGNWVRTGSGAALGQRSPAHSWGEASGDPHSLRVHCPLQLGTWFPIWYLSPVFSDFWGRACRCLHFADEGTEAQRDETSKQPRQNSNLVSWLLTCTSEPSLWTRSPPLYVAHRTPSPASCSSPQIIFVPGNPTILNRIGTKT